MDLYNNLFLFSLGIITFYANNVLGLECYACNKQDSNKDKCIKTTKQCEEHQNVCVTVVRWGLPPYWTPYGERMHYVTKECDRREQCEANRDEMMKYCKRDWFDDWSCTECCSGDLCNYYVTLGAPDLRTNAFTLSFAVLFATAAGFRGLACL